VGFLPGFLGGFTHENPPGFFWVSTRGFWTLESQVMLTSWLSLLCIALLHCATSSSYFLRFGGLHNRPTTQTTALRQHNAITLGINWLNNPEDTRISHFHDINWRNKLEDRSWQTPKKFTYSINRHYVKLRPTGLHMSSHSIVCLKAFRVYLRFASYANI